MKDQEEYSIRHQNSIQEQFKASQIHQKGEKKWLRMAYNLIEKENAPPLFKLDSITEKNPLKGTRLFDYFVMRLKEWNNKVVKNAANCTKKEISVFTFIYSYMKNLSRKPADVQQSLLENLFAWYQQSINPKPKITDILKGLKKRAKVHTSEDESVRKTFNSNLSLKINHFYRRQFGNSFNTQQIGQMFKKTGRMTDMSMEQKMTNRIKQKEEYNLRTWREEKELNNQIELALEYRTKRDQMAYRTSTGAFRNTARNKISRAPRPSSQQVEDPKAKKSRMTPSIGGLTLMVNPYEMKKK